MVRAENFPLTSRYTEQQVAQALVQDNQWIPFPAYTDRTAWDSLIGAQRERLIQQGERRLNYRWKHNLATDYIEYDRSGNRRIMEDPMSHNHTALSDLVLAELAEGQGRFMDQIVNGLWLECERTSWVLSAHQFRQPSKRTLPDWRTPIIDLGSGEVAGMMAWTCYLLHDSLERIDPMICQRVEHELRQRIVIPYLNNDREWWMALHLKPGAIVNNWNPWCNFNVLQTAMLCRLGQDTVQTLTWRTMQSVDRFINYVNSDGACEEGPSYWGHAAGKLFDYLDLLSRITGGRIQIFDLPQINAMGQYFVATQAGNNWVVNFADATARFTDNISALVYRYGQAVHNRDMIQLAALMAQDRKSIIPGGTDLWRSLWSLMTEQAIRRTTPRLSESPCMWYPQTQFCYFRNTDRMLAIKGGHNNESHNHNDVGTCIFYSHQTPVLIDAGVGTYTKQTFSSERYQIWSMQSAYHNLPTINGTDQQHGAQYKAGAMNVDQKRQQASIEIASAYPDASHAQNWTRTYQLNKSELTITDRFQITNPTMPNVVHFMLRGDIDISTPGYVNIRVDNQQLRLTYDAQQLTAELETITLTDERLRRVWGEQIYRLNLTDSRLKPTDTYSFHIK
ncbi:MAG: heparinase II/III family protein [Paludibacteraceae bacterium]|nr:heparinase II/III family protein [Paludibacteraceae bacterium]